MSKNQLAFVRVVVPGFLALIVTYTVLAKHFSLAEGLERIEFEEGTKSFVTALIVGAIYSIFHIRDTFVLQGHWKKIRENINDKMLEMLPSGALTREQASELRSGKKLINLFYSIVDKDETLMLRRDAVYDNGAYVSSTADLIVFSLLGSVFHFGLGLATSQAKYFQWAGLFFVIWILGLLLLRKALINHRKLSDDQLEFIADHHKSAVRAKLLTT